jgi:N-acetylgalactosamine kinase
MYNKRVVECRLASVLLAKKLDLPDWKTAFPLLRLCELTNKSREELYAKTVELLEEDPFTAESAAAALELPSVEELLTDIKMAPGVLANNNDFHLKKRALHVFSEASRVFDFQAVCGRALPKEAEENKEAAVEAEAQKLKELGALMNASHSSCDKLFDCSCEALNKLQSICLYVCLVCF